MSQDRANLEEALEDENSVAYGQSRMVYLLRPVSPFWRCINARRMNGQWEKRSSETPQDVLCAEWRRLLCKSIEPPRSRKWENGYR